MCSEHKMCSGFGTHFVFQVFGTRGRKGGTTRHQKIWILEKYWIFVFVTQCVQNTYCVLNPSWTPARLFVSCLIFLMRTWTLDIGCEYENFYFIFQSSWIWYSLFIIDYCINKSHVSMMYKSIQCNKFIQNYLFNGISTRLKSLCC